MLELSKRGWRLEVAAGPKGTSARLFNQQVDAPLISLDRLVYMYSIFYVCIHACTYVCM